MANRRDPILGPVLVLVVAIAAAAWALWPQSKASSGSSPVRATFAPVTPSSTSKPAVPLTGVLAKLQDGQPVDVQVIGDSTGNDPGEWVDLWARAIGSRFHRRVTVSTVNLTTVVYPPAVTVHAGPGPAVTVWNGSIPGYSAAMASASLAKLTAGPPADLLFVNLGHNGFQSDALDDEGALVDAALAKWPHAAVVIIVQNPQVDPALGVDRQAAVTAQIKDFARYRGFPFVDVFSAFTATGNPSSLILPGGVHPNAAGSRLWAKQVMALFPRR